MTWVQARGGVQVARRGKAKPGRARGGLFAPPLRQVLDRTDSKLGKRRRTSDYDFGDVIMPPMPGTKALAQLPVSPLAFFQSPCLLGLPEFRFESHCLPVSCSPQSWLSLVKIKKVESIASAWVIAATRSDSL